MQHLVLTRTAFGCRGAAADRGLVGGSCPDPHLPPGGGADAPGCHAPALQRHRARLHPDLCPGGQAGLVQVGHSDLCFMLQGVGWLRQACSRQGLRSQARLPCRTAPAMLLCGLASRLPPADAAGHGLNRDFGSRNMHKGPRFRAWRQWHACTDGGLSRCRVQGARQSCQTDAHSEVWIWCSYSAAGA